MMNKKPIVILAALSLSYGVQAQNSLEDGIKMVNYERYASAQKILEPLAPSNPKANYYLGLAALGNENKAAAKTIFAKFPEDPANMAGTAMVSFAEGNSADGQAKALATAAKAKKKDWEPLKYAADALAAPGGNPTQAVDLYTRALEKAPGNASIHIAMGDAYQKIEGGAGKAMSNYQEVTDKDQKNSLAYSRTGALWYAARRYDSALVNYARAKDADPSNPLPYRDLAYAYFYIGKYELAKQNIEQYLKLGDQSVEDKVQYANILYLAKYYPEAIDAMQQLLNSGAGKPYMYRIIGYSQFETKDYDNAAKNMDLFFAKQDPSKILPSDYLYYAKLFSHKGEVDSADKYFTKAVSLDSAKDKSETYRQVADGFKDLKSEIGYNKAGEWYGKIVADNPETKPLDYFNWGLYKYYGKDYPAAAAAFAKMRAKYPEQPSAVYWQGRVAAAIDNEAKSGDALPYFNEWLALDSVTVKKQPADLNKAYQYLGLYYYNKNDVPQTKIYIEKILQLDPNDKFAKQLQDAIAPKKAAAPKPKAK
jgi:tetratricopeptide (TPR) repeat protein